MSDTYPRVFSTMPAAYRGICNEVLEKGLVVSPRGEETRELLSYNFRLLDPHGAITRKGYSEPMAAVEAIQLIGGFSDPELVVRINPTMVKFMSDEGGQVIYQHGNYGERIGPYLSYVVDKLKIDPDTRQAVINIFDTGRDYVDEPDIPCTTSLQFMIRDFALDLHVSMRSNDIWWGLPYDMFQFTQLQMSVANVLNLVVGDYYHTANSMHAYARNFDEITAMLRGSMLGAHYVPCGLNAPSIPNLQQLCRYLADGTLKDDEPGPGSSNLTPSEAWYANQLAYVSPRAT